MMAAVLRCELHIPEANSLKARRAALRPTIEGLRRSMSVSVAEVDHQDTWQRAALGIAVVARAGEIDRMVDRIVAYLDDRPDLALVSCAVGYVDNEDLHDRMSSPNRYPDPTTHVDAEVPDV